MTVIEAHITGTVWKVEVQVGDTVQEGDTVVILESMKMEMPVEAEDPGVVAEIRCHEASQCPRATRSLSLSESDGGLDAAGRLLVDKPAPGVVRLTISDPARRGALDLTLLATLERTLGEIDAPA